MSTAARPGSLVCVGLGMMLGAHLGPRARSHIEQADVVFVAASDALVELWLQEMRPDVRSLQPFYAEGKPRHLTYREMTEAMLTEVRAGRRVCGAFYGHPGVFAKVPHDAITQARAEGFDASMEPGISAADCLYSDLGIDPGSVGCQHFEASQLLFYRRTVDPSAYLVLWQVGLVGDRSHRRFGTSPAHRQLLVDRLLAWYPSDHEVLIYEASTSPLAPARCERLALDELPRADLYMHSTLVVPPARSMEPDGDMLARIAALDADERSAPAARKRKDVPTATQKRGQLHV
ncbi:MULTISPECIES: SAM-dependent methyltransferase [unclassified Lysobacter]